ncbi:MAG: RNA polymerase sigma factor [Bacteroidia bacterium]
MFVFIIWWCFKVFFNASRLPYRMTDETLHNKDYNDESIDGIISRLNSEFQGFISSRVANPRDGEDILQEVWLQFSSAWHKQTIKQPRAWLYRVIRNKIIDLYRKKSPEWLEDYLYEESEEYQFEAETEIDGWEQPEVIYLQEQFWEALYEALETLPSAQREVFLLNELEGHTLREIAEQKGENLKTIISRKGYAMRALREKLVDIFAEFVEVD